MITWKGSNALVCDEKLMKMVSVAGDLSGEVYENSENVPREMEAENKTMWRKGALRISMPFNHFEQRRLREFSHLTSDIHSQFTRPSFDTTVLELLWSMR